VLTVLADPNKVAGGSFMLNASRHSAISCCLIASSSLVVFALFGLIGSPESASASGPGPVAAYPLDAGEGTVAEDAAGEHEGTIEGAEWTNGKYGSALQFSGNEECVSVPDSPELQLEEEFTLEAWVKPEGEVSHDPILFKETEGFSSYSLGIAFQGSGKADAYIGEEGEEYENVVSPEKIPGLDPSNVVTRGRLIS
jgi:hypothetical protein